MISLVVGKELNKGQKIQVYRNIRKATFSIRDYKTRQVIAYGTNIRLSNIKLVVQKSGRERVIREKWKNVHAYVVGTFEGTGEIEINECWTNIYYNPYTTKSFINLITGEPIFRAEKAFLSEGKCFVQY